MNDEMNDAQWERYFDRKRAEQELPPIDRSRKYINKREGELKSQFTEVMRQLFPEYVVLLYASAGAPDRSITAHGRTTTWEFKHGTPDFASPGLQELTCMRLAAAGHCRYVIWEERRGVQRTLICHPRAVHDRIGWSIVAERWCVGFDHHWLAREIARAHRV